MTRWHVCHYCPPPDEKIHFPQKGSGKRRHEKRLKSRHSKCANNSKRNEEEGEEEEEEEEEEEKEEEEEEEECLAWFWTWGFYGPRRNGFQDVSFS